MNSYDLQMEPQLSARYSDYLAEYLRSGFTVRQIGNTYNVVSNGLEQMMTLLILVIGAYTVMTSDSTSGQAFSIGMLIAFQMYSSKVSQPMQRVLLGLQPLTTTAYPLRVLRLVGLWQQFQQANLSVQRLGDLMNAPAEPYSIVPTRLREGKGEINIESLAFRYTEDRPFLYENFQLKVPHGKVVAIMGSSGSGKSTLTKLLQGFYQPSSGTIKIDGCGRVAAKQRGTHRRTPCGCTDIRYLSANELRHYFGVVPQETVLFSGTIYENEPHAASFSAG